MVTNHLRLIGAMEHRDPARKDPANASRASIYNDLRYFGKSFPGVVANARMPGPAQAAVKVLLFRIYGGRVPSPAR